jgi:putative ABC transport system permease protein
MHRTFIYRQITSSIKQTSVFVACVALSIVTLVSIGGFGESVNNALLRDARVLLAGDIVVRSGFPFEEPLIAELERLRSEPGVDVALSYQFITIVRTVEGENTLLSELKVVESGYPFYGEVVTLSGHPLKEVLSSGQILVAQNLLDRLGLQVGDSLKVGEETLTISDVVVSEPDQPVDFFSLGPRIFLSADDLDTTGLIKPGSRVNYRALIRVVDETKIESVAARLSAVADTRQVRVDTYLTNQSAVQIFFDNFLTFLSLIGIFTLFLAGIGIQSSLSSFIREREETIAILRTFGAQGRFVMIQFLGITAILGLSGTFIGLALAILMEMLFPFLFGPFLPPQVDFTLSIRAIVEGMLLGFVVVTIFTFLPIYQLQGFKPRYIFRKEPSEVSRGWVFYASQVMILFFLTAMTFRYLNNLERTAYFSIGVVVMVLTIALLAHGVLSLLRRGKIAALDVRQALRGLFRPRNATAGIIVTLAAALTVLFTIYLIERNLDASFVQAYPEDAPNLVILDIQPDQRDGIRDVLGEGTEFTPLVFARIRRINGVEVMHQGEDQSEPEMGPNPDNPPQLDDLFAITYRDSLAPDEALMDGDTIFAPGEVGLAQVSISEILLETYPFAIGDRIEFEIQGVPLVAQLTSIRSVKNDGSGFGPPSFNFVLREQDLINAPQTIVTTTTIPDEEIPEFQNRLVASFPNLTVVDIRATIATLAGLVADITTIIRFFTAFSIVAGVLIIISSVLATRFARIQESVYFKVLGAKRIFVLRVFALENVFIGLVSAILALFLSQVASWLLVTQVFELSYAAYWGSSILLMCFTVALVTSVGLLASISILKKKPITFLREQAVE